MALAQTPDPRVTPAVKVIAEIQPAIVPIFCKDGSGAVSGSGVLIHEQGYVLTADHVTRDREGFVIFGLTRAPFKVVGRLPERDLALLKVDVPSTISSVRLGGAVTICASVNPSPLAAKLSFPAQGSAPQATLGTRTKIYYWLWFFG